VIVNFLKIGTISSRIKKTGIFLFALQFVLILSALSYVRWQDSSKGCVSCHSDRSVMQRLGYPYFYVTQEQVELESGHSTAECRDCHLGNGRGEDINKAHEGLLKMVIVSESGDILPREKFFPKAFLPEGDNQMLLMLPKIEIMDKKLVHSEVRNILYSDRSLKTFGYDSQIAERTCGQKGCHSDQVRQFNQTVMGTNFRQRTMRTWLDPYGPHNCGPSFADIPAEKITEGNRFSFENYAEIVKNLNTTFTQGQAVMKQKFCNVCHAGCLDCHYTPFKNEGVHRFTKIPPSQSCMGGGRGSTMCHTGSAESRRGGTYLGGDFTEPPGMKADIHVEKINCVDCHRTGPGGMGDIERKAECQDCHIEIEEAVSQSEHRKLQCITCHVKEAGGYQLTHWGEGHVGGKPNPFRKYSLYYGVFKPPIIMQNQRGFWIPVKVIPHTVGNIKNPVEPLDELLFRWPDGETDDSYVILGTFDNLPASNLHLAWLDIQKISHPYEKPRSCQSCHGSGGTQSAISTWEFIDDEGAKPFEGRHKVIAGKKGLRVVDIKNTTPIEPYPKARLADFAPWYYLKDIWKLSGDYSIPSRGLEQSEKAYQDVVNHLKKLKEKIPEKEFKKLRAKAVHNYGNFDF
jgi:hypothetical protein